MSNQETTEAPAEGKLRSLAVKLKEVGARLDELSKAKADLDGEWDQISLSIKEHLEAEGQQSVKLEGVGTVYLQGSTHAKVNPETKEALLAWLDERELGGLAPRTINSKTFAAQYREWEEGDKPLPPAEFVSVYREVSARFKSK